jgi:hypothetical protein
MQFLTSYYMFRRPAAIFRDYIHKCIQNIIIYGTFVAVVYIFHRNFRRYIHRLSNTLKQLMLILKFYALDMLL